MSNIEHRSRNLSSRLTILPHHTVLPPQLLQRPCIISDSLYQPLHIFIPFISHRQDTELPGLCCLPVHSEDRHDRLNSLSCSLRECCSQAVTGSLRTKTSSLTYYQHLLKITQFLTTSRALFIISRNIVSSLARLPSFTVQNVLFTTPAFFYNRYRLMTEPITLGLPPFPD